MAAEYQNFQYNACSSLVCNVRTTKKKSSDTVHFSENCGPGYDVQSARKQLITIGRLQYRRRGTIFFKSTNLSAYVADMIWKNANDLLQAHNSIVPAPGKVLCLCKKDTYECESTTNQVKCVHTCIIAVAKTNGDLDKFIAWHEQYQHEVNVTHLAESGLSKSSIG